MILFSPSRDHNLLSVSGSFLVNSHHDSVFFQRSYWTSESNFHARNAVWNSSDWLNAQTWVASSSSKPPHISADTTTVTLRVAQHGAHSALIAEWRRNDAVFLSVAWVPNLIRAQFSAGAHSWACSCMQLLTGLERARVTGCGEKKSKPKKFLVLGWFFREKKKLKETKKEKCFGYRYLQTLHQMMTKTWCTLSDPRGAHVVLTFQSYRQFQKSFKEASMGCNFFSFGNHSVDGKFSIAWCSAWAFLFKKHSTVWIARVNLRQLFETLGPWWS